MYINNSNYYKIYSSFIFSVNENHGIMSRPV